jgi:hypothetical protein
MKMHFLTGEEEEKRSPRSHVPDLTIALQLSGMLQLICKSLHRLLFSSSPV